jgi:hypothetical protein
LRAGGSLDYFVTTLLLVDGELLSIEEAPAKFLDPDYIDGAIIWAVGNKEILTPLHWDLVDQLWAYMLTGAQEVADGKSFKCYFPDQPLRIQFDIVSHEKVRVNIGDDETTIDIATFFESILSGAETCFTALHKKLLSKKKPYDHQLAAISSLRKQIGFGVL